MTPQPWNVGRVVGAVAIMGAISAPAQAQEIIRLDGSTGTAPLVRALGKEFEARGGVRVEVGKGLGTRARMEALAGGKIDIAMASHGLKVDEITARGMRVYRIATTPVVFGVHKSVAVKSLTDEQVCRIYRGELRNWKEVGGNDLAIVPMTRPDTEVDAEVVRAEIGCFKQLKYPDFVQVQNRAGDMAKALAAATGAIGMTTATVVEQSGGAVRTLALNGVEPSAENVLRDRYKLMRDAFLVTQGAPSAAVKAFLGFVTGEDGAKIIAHNGAIAVAKR